MPSKETSVCVAPLHHAIVKPEGLELNTYSHPENLWGRNDQNKLILIVAHGGETDEKMVTDSKKKKKGGGGGGARVVSYLDFTSFHQRAVQLLSGPLCICARLECYKTEALQAEEREEWEKEGRGRVREGWK